jgi:NADH-quinone oxidoreductase subunit K
MFLGNYLFVSNSVFIIGLLGMLLNRQNIIIVLMSVELILLGCNLNFIIFSHYLDDVIGQLFALLVLTVAAAESGIGLAIIIVYFKIRRNILIDTNSVMRS